VRGAGKGESEDEGQGGLHGEIYWEERGQEGGELGAREDAVRGCASDEGLEDFGTEEGAVGEDVVRGWGQEFEIEAGGGHGAGELRLGGKHGLNWGIGLGL
jgi:hypothetical protein